LAVDNPTGLFLVNDYVVTHNTKMGKTTFMMNATLHAARFHGEVVLNYQVELSPDEYVGLMAAYLLQRNRNNLTHEDMMEACAIMTRENIQYYIGRNQSLTTVTPVLDLIEDAIRRYGITVVVLDHIHFICRNEKDEVQAQANAMQRIKNMAGTYKIKFIVVGQPRKATAANRGKMVHITDAKGSESFSSDADAVYAIHRDWIREKDPANPPMDDYNPETEVHMLGARFKGNGSTMQTLFFNGATATFREISGAQVPKIDGGQTGQLCYNGNGVE
jgi:replicative DNA helicase